MDAERWQRLRQVFAAVIDIPQEEASARLDELCAGDPELRQEAAALLACHRETGDLLPTGGAALGAEGALGAESALTGRLLGRYRVLEVLGRGGMGVVYRAERADAEFEKKVALKVLRPGLDSAELVRRFRAERQILAQLDHPHIARLLDGGTTPEGLPFLVMELVDGLPIDRWCAAHDLPLRARLELFDTVCRTVHFAHQRLVVHRDLKPGNILVGADGEPKLLDFGIAKLLAPGGETAATAPAGWRPVTPEYGSPEQLQGEPVTTASDVWSLGVLLCELLTGRHPYRERTASFDELRRWLSADGEVEPPSAVLRRAVAGASAGDPGCPPWHRRLAGDLDAIAGQALRREPGRRYASAEQLAEDVRRHLDGRPVRARRASFAGRAAKLVRRHRVAAAAAATLALSLLGFGAALGLQAVEIAEERDRATAVTAFLVEAFAVSDPQRATGATVTAREILDAGAARLASLDRQPEVQSDLRTTLGAIYRRLGLYDRAGPLLAAALAERRRRLGEEHPKVAESLSELALLREDQGDYAAAEPLYRRALELRREHFGPRHPDVAQTVSDLAGVQWATGRYAAAEQGFRDALELRRELFGPQSPEVAKSLNNLGVLLWTVGRYGEADERLREALAVRRQLYGPVHLEVADNLNNLSLVAQNRGDLASAEQLTREALAIWRKLLGPRHPRLAIGLNNLGRLLMLERRFAAAEPPLRAALALRRELLGGDHPELAQTLENLGEVALGRRDLGAADRYLAEALAIRLRLFGEEHVTIADTWRCQGKVLAARGRYAAAEALLGRATALHRKLLGSAHPSLAGFEDDLRAVREARRGAAGKGREGREVRAQL